MRVNFTLPTAAMTRKFAEEASPLGEVRWGECISITMYLSHSLFKHILLRPSVICRYVLPVYVLPSVCSLRACRYLTKLSGPLDRALQLAVSWSGAEPRSQIWVL